MAATTRSVCKFDHQRRRADERSVIRRLSGREMADYANAHPPYDTSQSHQLEILPPEMCRHAEHLLILSDTGGIQVS